MASKEKPVQEMCEGCARNKGMLCEVIKEPGWLFISRGECFAWVDKDRAREIEQQIKIWSKRRRIKWGFATRILK